jgi:hypothetical protein
MRVTTITDVTQPAAERSGGTELLIMTLTAQPKSGIRNVWT